MKKYFLLTFISFCTINAVSQEATMQHRDSLTSVVNDYYELNLKAFQAGSTPKDIDAIFALFTEDFTYVHPKYGGTYSREDLYNGYLNNQKNGRYDGNVLRFKRENIITGLNAVVVEKRFVTMGENGPEEGKKEMTLFEFKNGKISRIFEYW